jgi:hypothetical protein
MCITPSLIAACRVYGSVVVTRRVTPGLSPGYETRQTAESLSGACARKWRRAACQCQWPRAGAGDSSSHAAPFSMGRYHAQWQSPAHWQPVRRLARCCDSSHWHWHWQSDTQQGPGRPGASLARPLFFDIGEVAKPPVAPSVMMELAANSPLDPPGLAS